MPAKSSQMKCEIGQIPQAISYLLDIGAAPVRATADTLRALDPAYLITVARGSSDHAASYLKYASELLLGLPVASVGPSVASVYQAPLRVANTATLAISQSGKSPDIVRLTESLGRGGSHTIALTNDTGAPLADCANATIDICAGIELSVAATKTFVTSAVAGLWLLAEWKQDTELLAAIRALPEVLDKARAADWSEMRAAVRKGGSVFTLGRGPSWAISNEAALKFKETCQRHAESYSSAEVMHGPVSIVGADFPVLAFACADAAETSVVEIADQIAAKGANVFVTSTLAGRAKTLTTVRTGHPLTDPLALIVSFYAMVEGLAADLGIDPDAPRHLNKVTETV